MKNLMKTASAQNFAGFIRKFESMNNDEIPQVDFSRDLQELGENIKQDPIFSLKFSKEQVQKIAEYISKNHNAEKHVARDPKSGMTWEESFVRNELPDGNKHELKGIFMTTLKDFGNVEIEVKIDAGQRVLYIKNDSRKANYDAFCINIETGKFHSGNVNKKDGISKIDRMKNAFQEILEKIERGDKI